MHLTLLLVIALVEKRCHLPLNWSSCPLHSLTNRMLHCMTDLTPRTVFRVTDDCFVNGCTTNDWTSVPFGQLGELWFSTPASCVQFIVLACEMAMIAMLDKVDFPRSPIHVWPPPPIPFTHFNGKALLTDSGPRQAVCTGWVRLNINSHQSTCWKVKERFIQCCPSFKPSANLSDSNLHSKISECNYYIGNYRPRTWFFTMVTVILVIFVGCSSNIHHSVQLWD